MSVKTYYRGHYPRGHGIKCKHCGYPYEAHHGNPGSVRDPKVCQKGFKISFSQCGPLGYEPQSVEKWKHLERGPRETRVSFEMEWLERQAQGEAAWGMYAAQMRTQNFNRDRAEFEEKLTRAHSDSERKEAQENLTNFLQNARRNAHTMHIGSGVGSSNPDDFD